MEAIAESSTGQYLTFKLDKELFAVEIARVREVLEFTSMTKVPRTLEFMRGVINLRGNVVPVLDMRLKLGLSMTEKTVDTCVVISEVAIGEERNILGVLVDSVQEVISLNSSDVAPPPQMGSRAETAVIRGMGKRDDQFIMLLDFDRVFTVEELRSSRSASTAETNEARLLVDGTATKTKSSEL